MTETWTFTQAIGIGLMLAGAFGLFVTIVGLAVTLIALRSRVKIRNEEEWAMLTVEERYQRDPMFRRLVDLIYSILEEGNTTPTEVREACMLAQYKFESAMHRPAYTYISGLHKYGCRDAEGKK